MLFKRRAACVLGVKLPSNQEESIEGGVKQSGHGEATVAAVGVNQEGDFMAVRRELTARHMFYSVWVHLEKVVGTGERTGRWREMFLKTREAI